MPSEKVLDVNIIHKTFRAEVKEVDEETGVVNALIPMSTASRDRDNEIIDPQAFKKNLKQTSDVIVI